MGEDGPRWPARVRVCEVGPRDGLQNERVPIATEDKVRYIDMLSAAGLPYIEVTSFVSPRWVPQLADHSEVLQRIRRRPGTRYAVLVPNDKGLERALAAGADAIAVFTGATETFTRKNINQSVQQSLERFARIVERARAEGCWVRGYLSCVFGCPYEGEVAPERVVELCRELDRIGCHEIALGDTIGRAGPIETRDVVRRVKSVVGLDRLALHLHDTTGLALTNVLVALQEGVRIFDAASGGLGGCPYAPGASGNLATEDLLYLLDRLGIAHGVDRQQVARASHFIERRIGRPLPGRVLASERARLVCPVAEQPRQQRAS
ncbi:MAG: hydroxymethylglutaryl-CoA lyase [Planctomycetota bacterium]|nr:MAG: hydroxymethylglutaryl-CoA lyase [Planctomycetota bacterium]